MNEVSLLKGTLEPTNEQYAVAKIAGLKICESYNRQYIISYSTIMPTTLYRIGDNFHIHEAKMADLPEVEIWGSELPNREVLFVNDLVDAGLFYYTMTKIIHLSISVTG